MSDLPDNPADLTPDQAREAPAGPETDRMCLRVMGAKRINSVDVLGPFGEMHSRIQDDQPPLGLQVSRRPEAAHRARQWIDDNTPSGEVGVTRMNSEPGYDASCDMPLEAGGHVVVFAETEHLATARLLLLLAAEGVLEVDT